MENVIWTVWSIWLLVNEAHRMSHINLMDLIDWTYARPADNTGLWTKMNSPYRPITVIHPYISLATE